VKHSTGRQGFQIKPVGLGLIWKLTGGAGGAAYFKINFFLNLVIDLLNLFKLSTESSNLLLWAKMGVLDQTLVVCYFVPACRLRHLLLFPR
jgi:hypothetical protein